MFYLLLKAVHVLCVVLWVGGMAFAHFCLRPAVLIPAGHFIRRIQFELELQWS